MKQTLEHPIVFFDGICNFCNSSVDYLIRHNKNKDLRYASLQSDFAINSLKQHGITAVDLNSVYFYKNGTVYNKSTAALKLLPHLDWYYFPLYSFWLIPKFIRNYCYDLIARKRYLLLGKRESCRIPTPEEAQLFIS